MAYYNEEDDKDKNQSAEEQPETPGSAPSGVLGGSGASDSPSGAQSTAGQSNAADHFVGIQQYINANKPQSEKLAQNVGSGVVGQGNQARSALDQGKSSFDQAVSAATVKDNPDLDQKVQSQAEKLTDEEKGSFRKQQAAQYSGPSSFEETPYYTPTQQAVQGATQAAENTKTEAGQRQLLAPLEQQAKHGTSAGIGTFDSALLQAAPNARTELANARQSVSDLDPKFQQMLSDALQSSAGAKTTTEGAANAAKQAVQSGVGGLDVQKRYGDYTAGANSYNAARTADVGDDALDPETRALLGLSTGQNLYNTDLSKFLQSNPAASLSQFASPEDYARYSALQDLGGQFDYSLNKDEAGTGGSGKVTGKAPELAKALGDSKAAYESAISKPVFDSSNGSPASWNDLVKFYQRRSSAGSDHLNRLISMEPQELANVAQLNKIRAQYGQPPIDANELVKNGVYKEIGSARSVKEA